MNENPKLLHIGSYSWETGGTANFIFNHSQYQVKQGVSIDIASAVYPSQRTYDIPSGVRLFQFPKSFFSRFLSEFSWEMIFWFWKNRNNYDYIHLHGLWHFGAILPFIIPCRAKKIITIHGFLNEYALQSSWLLKRIFWILFQKRFLRRADKLHAINDEEYDTLMRLFPEKKDQIALICNGIEDPLKKNYGTANPSLVAQIEAFIQDSSLIFLFLGRKHEIKGLDILLAAFAAIGDKYAWNARLILAGPDDNYSPAIATFLEKYPRKDIFQLSLVSGAEKDFLYKNTTMVVLPSYSEGFSIAALEAMAYGKPSLLSTKVGFTKDINKYKAALLFEPTYEGILAAFEKIIAEPELGDSFKQNARNLFVENFQMHEISDKMYHFLFD